ncbi:helix-turn-helix transcriptional regulator [Candidatus Viadribacter manganicus]|uniref:Uncharacterized protein n=1 Tax=Candidatus Viadribacter manganicus TaxID=1759059 RepID=A0A1B1AHJ7_9PROT|nr:hypothetical protein [Candidatus Viadribacter manganicus]ANP46025.1 hypothetical protein ATE48_08880 [Candidatus Viadribacter manganicus]
MPRFDRWVSNAMSLCAGDRLLRPKQIHKPDGILPIGRSKFYELIQLPDFPPAIRFLDGTRMWSEMEIWRWVTENCNKFGGAQLADSLSLACRQKMAVDANANAAWRRMEALADEMVKRKMDIQEFAALRCDTGDQPFEYLTRAKLKKSYAYETLERGLRRVIKKRARREMP